MGLWDKQQPHVFIKDHNLVTAQYPQNSLKDLFAETLKEMLETGMDQHLVTRSIWSRTSKSRTAETEKVKRRLATNMGEQEILVP